MTDMSKHAKLTKGQRRALAVAVTLVAAGMAIGFLSSFTTLSHCAGARLALPGVLPMAVDSGILAYVLLDHLAVSLDARSSGCTGRLGAGRVHGVGQRGGL